MAATATATRLTERQRIEQGRVAAATVAKLVDLWPTSGVSNLDGAFERFARSAMTVVQDQRKVSSATAASYYTAIRAAELGRAAGRFTVPVVGPADPKALATSLLVTGPVGIKQRLARGVEPDEAFKRALVDTSGAATRHVLDGGRGTLVFAAEEDEQAVGFARVTGPNPCGFCLLLASRGFVYKTRATATLTTKRSKKRGAGQEYHDHDQCTVEPAFTDDAALPASAARAEALYREASANVSGMKAIATEMARLAAAA